MTISIANVNPTSDTFQSWVDKTNQIATGMSTVVLTTAANTIGGQNSANAYLNGIFAANTFVAVESLRGGTVAASGNLTISSNAIFTGANVSLSPTYLNLTATTSTLNSNTLTMGGTSLVVTANVNLKSNTVSIISTGRVGINTGIADAALSVVGGANVSGALAVGGNLAAAGVTTLLGTIALTGNATFSNTLAVAGNTTFSNTVGIVGAVTLSNTVIVTGNVSFSNTLAVTGNVALSNTLTVTGAASFGGTMLVNGAITLNAVATATKITFDAGAANGIFWPNNAFGGTGDTASITLQRDGVSGEDQRLVFALGNEANDKFNFTANSNDGLLMNGYTVWHAGNDGSASQLDAHFLDGLTQTSSATGSTIIARDSSGNFSANVMSGTATTARYADLAENYLADAVYPVGTVVTIGGEKEVTACTFGTLAIGAVSAKPAYLMNSELVGGTPIALKGRVPVSVTGVVRKGDRLVAGNTGTAIVGSILSNDVFAVSLETSSNPLTKLVECLIL